MRLVLNTQRAKSFTTIFEGRRKREKTSKFSRLTEGRKLISQYVAFPWLSLPTSLFLFSPPPVSVKWNKRWAAQSAIYIGSLPWRRPIPPPLGAWYWTRGAYSCISCAGAWELPSISLRRPSLPSDTADRPLRLPSPSRSRTVETLSAICPSLSHRCYRPEMRVDVRDASTKG